MCLLVCMLLIFLCSLIKVILHKTSRVLLVCFQSSVGSEGSFPSHYHNVWHLHLENGWTLHCKKFETPSPKNNFAKFGWNWPSSFWEEVEIGKVYRQTDVQTDRRRTTGDQNSSGELKRNSYLNIKPVWWNDTEVQINYAKWFKPLP